MIHHAAAVAALLASQTSSAPIVVQLVQKTEPESWLKWLLPAIIQTVVSLLSIAAGVTIAWRSFHATSEKDHKRWLLDQKKAEWKELLKKASEIQRVLPVSSASSKERAHLIADQLKPLIRELAEVQASCVFLADFFKNRQQRERFFIFLKDADDAVEAINCLFALDGMTEVSQDERLAQISELRSTSDGITMKYFNFMDWARSQALENLDVNSRTSKPLA
jgi:hypothetical protein